MKEIELIEKLRKTALGFVDFQNKVPFNLLLASSDTYYRENLHSQILAFILNENKFFVSFVDYLNKNYQTTIDIDQYQNPSILPEDEGRIDVLIKDETTKHCIIIENKINNAVDMERQLPRYIEAMKKKNYQIDVIIYYSINGFKEAEDRSWTTEDKVLVKKEKLINLAAIGREGKALTNGFLRKELQGENKFAEICFLSQYVDLLEYLGRGEMKNENLEVFYTKMLEGDNYKVASGVAEMLKNLASYRRDRIRAVFASKKGPFERIDPYSSYATNFHQISRFTNQNIKLDIICSDVKTIVKFWIQEPNITNDMIGGILKEIGMSELFLKNTENEYTREYEFPNDENEIDNFISLFLDELGKYVNSEISKKS